MSRDDPFVKNIQSVNSTDRAQEEEEKVEQDSTIRPLLPPILIQKTTSQQQEQQPVYGLQDYMRLRIINTRSRGGGRVFSQTLEFLSGRRKLVAVVCILLWIGIYCLETLTSSGKGTGIQTPETEINIQGLPDDEPVIPVTSLDVEITDKNLNAPAQPESDFASSLEQTAFEELEKLPAETVSIEEKARKLIEGMKNHVTFMNTTREPPFNAKVLPAIPPDYQFRKIHSLPGQGSAFQVLRRITTDPGHPRVNLRLGLEDEPVRLIPQQIGTEPPQTLTENKGDIYQQTSTEPENAEPDQGEVVNVTWDENLDVTESEVPLPSSGLRSITNDPYDYEQEEKTETPKPKVDVDITYDESLDIVAGERQAQRSLDTFGDGIAQGLSARLVKRYPPWKKSSLATDQMQM